MLSQVLQTAAANECGCRFILVVLSLLLTSQIIMAERFFPADLPEAQWSEFTPAGYDQPVTGVIYRSNLRPISGMALGGLDTGCFDIESVGLIGYNTIFNELYPRGLENLPFLGLKVAGRTWLMTTKQAKKYSPQPTKVFPHWDYRPQYYELSLNNVNTPSAIDYWGHYPIVDMEYETDAPVSLGLRAFSPFIPGDTITSMAPGAIFELRLQNTTDKNQNGTVAFSFPGFPRPSLGIEPKMQRFRLNGRLNGYHILSPFRNNQWELSYVLAALDEDDVRLGEALNRNTSAWSRMDTELPHERNDRSGSSLACDFKLKPGQSKTIRIVLAWYAPHFKAGGNPEDQWTNTFTHMYAKHYPSALDTAQFLADNHESLLKRIIAWQQAVFNHPDIPGYLAEQLINALYLIPEDSIWGQAKAPIGDWAKPELGVFGLNECPRGCAQIECIPCSFYGNMPIVYFFPECALSTLYAYRQYQYPDGRVPWVFGGSTARTPSYDLSMPSRGYQVVLNGAAYVVMVDRYWRIHNDKKLLKEFWQSLKDATDYSFTLRPEYGPSQIMAMPAGNIETEWFEAPEPGWKGYVTHAGGVRMAQAMIMREMAKVLGDKAYRKKCDVWLDAGAQALEEHLWNGSYYSNFNEPETNQRSDMIFGYQLDCEWITDWHGVPGVFPENRVKTTLETIKKINYKLSKTGAVNYANPNGTPALVGGYQTYSYFIPELFMLSMNYMYEGQKDFGLEMLKRCLHNIACTWGYTWDAPNYVRGDADTGERHFGADYYQNMMIWSIPAALANQDMTGPTKPGGLIHNVIQAGK